MLGGFFFVFGLRRVEAGGGPTGPEQARVFGAGSHVAGSIFRSAMCQTPRVLSARGREKRGAVPYCEAKARPTLKANTSSARTFDSDQGMNRRKSAFILWILVALFCGVREVSASEDEETVSDEGVGASEAVAEMKPQYKLYAGKHDVSATIETTEGALCCDLFIEEHPLTVLNFMALVRGTPAWTDRAGNPHKTPFYDGLKFDVCEKGTFASVGGRPEGTNFHVQDERCEGHEPVAGSLFMTQTHPGMASTRIAILARDVPEFSGMYTIFGQCEGGAVLEALTWKDASVVKIEIHEGEKCAASPAE